MTTTKKLRRDAAENLDRILDAAASVFAEKGFATSIEVVAQTAGIGLGTIYRRFENKDALVNELARRLLRNAVEIGERHLDDKHGQGLFGYLWEIGELIATNSGIVARMWNVPGAEDSIARSREAQARLLHQAQQTGKVRPDLVPEDIAVIAWSLSGVLDVTRGHPVKAWRRYLELYIASLSVSSPPLHESPLSAEDMDRLVSRTGQSG